MSVFPKRLSAGDTVLVHVQVNTEIVEFSHLNRFEVKVISPSGNKKTLGRESQIALKSGGRKSDLMLFELARTFRKTPPPSLFASYLKSSFQKKHEVLNFFEDSFRATHLYFAYKLPKSAEPGLYRIQVKFQIHGRKSESRTQNDDNFFVDSLKVLKTTAKKKHFEVLILNDSPHSVPFEVHKKAGLNSFSSGFLSLKPGASKIIRFNSDLGFIRYASNGKRFILRRDDSAICVLNLAKSPDARLLSSKKIRNILEKAGAFSLRSSVRTKDNQKEYDLLLKKKFIFEWKVDQFS